MRLKSRCMPQHDSESTSHSDEIWLTACAARPSRHRRENVLMNYKGLSDSPPQHEQRLVNIPPCMVCHVGRNQTEFSYAQDRKNSGILWEPRCGRETPLSHATAFTFM